MDVCHVSVKPSNFNDGSPVNGKPSFVCVRVSRSTYIRDNDTKGHCDNIKIYILVQFLTQHWQKWSSSTAWLKTDGKLVTRQHLELQHTGKRAKVTVSAQVSCFHQCQTELEPKKCPWLLRSHFTCKWMPIVTFPSEDNSQMPLGVRGVSLSSVFFWSKWH